MTGVRSCFFSKFFEKNFKIYADRHMCGRKETLIIMVNGYG